MALVGRTEPENPAEAPGLHTASSLMPLLKDLPVACNGGWFAIRDAIFGPGWPGRHGACVDELATELRSSGHDHACEAAERLAGRWLLPPGDPRWENAAIEGAALEERADFLEQAGVVNGLRLRTAEPRRFSMSANHKSLPREAPESTPQDRWDNWRSAARTALQPGYVGPFPYELSEVCLLPELDFIDDLSAAGRRALSELILVSLVHWPKGWERARITKKKGSPWSTTVSSPLRHWLRTFPWLLDGQRRRVLDQRWLVPESLLQGQRGRFSHLSALSLKLAHRLGEEPELRKTLEQLGLHVYPTEDDRTGPELLEALAAACDEGEMPAGGFDVLLGQVRHAWRYMDPAKGLPARFLVRTRPRSFEIRGADALTDVYIPDHGARTRSLREQGKPILEMHADEARRAVGERLDEMKVRRASALSERCLADRRPAADLAEGAPPLDETELRWLPVVLLTLVAHGGANPRGPATDAWQEAAARLRRARVLHCSGISVELVDGERVVAASEPPAHWLSTEAVFVLRHDSDSSYDELASACQAMLDRQDLLKDLRLVLGALPRAAPEPTQEQIAAALDRAEIDPELLADIRHRWYGPTTLLVDRVRPLVELLEIRDDGIDAAADVDALTEWLSSNLPACESGKWPAEEVVKAARSSRNDFEMGREAWRRVGERAQLPAWNAALAKLGDRYATVENRDASEQASRYIEEAAPFLRALARYAAIEAKAPDLFRNVEKVSQDFKAPAAWSTLWWEVPFHSVLASLRAAYTKTLGIEACLVQVLDCASASDDLRAAFDQANIALDPDPYDTFRRNENRLSKQIGAVDDLLRAWLEVSEAYPIPPKSRVPESPRMDSSAYLRDWSDGEIFERALAALDNENFRTQCQGCASVKEARTKLELGPEAIERARRRRRQRQKKAERANRTFDIAGKPFEVDGPESLGDLLAHLDQLPEPEGPRAREDEPTPLIHPGPIPKPPPSPCPPTPRETPTYRSPHLPGLVGIVGEMHALRFLRSQFGSEVVTSASWVSENSLRALPPAAGEQRDSNDSHGFDFRFQFEGKTWCVEVKATTGDDTSFDLPASEIHAATRLAHSRRERWRILRIRNALTDRPEFDWLPNPFETGFSDLFRLSTGGMTVRYALDAAT